MTDDTQRAGAGMSTRARVVTWVTGPEVRRSLRLTGFLVVFNLAVALKLWGFDATESDPLTYWGAYWGAFVMILTAHRYLPW
jgi:hypothetical protein